jgi:hypothetical protein
MIKTIFCLTFVVIYQISFAQKMDTIEVVSFKNGKISTLKLSNHREGLAKAFNQKGEIIYESGTRRFAGHASVEFKHYPNGSVKQAIYSSAPDGGIQWYKTETYFDKNGIITHVNDLSYDRLMRPSYIIHTTGPNTEMEKTIHEQVKETEKQQQKEVAICANIHHNKIIIFNHTKKRLVIEKKINGEKWTIPAGESKEIMNYISAEITQKPQGAQEFLHNRKKTYEIVEKMEIGKLETHYIYHIFQSSFKK